jgi:putative ABC transport system substrate-binding protein
VALLADGDVIVHGNAERICDRDDPLRHLNGRLEGLGSAHVANGHGASGGDAVKLGLVPSLNRPGGNVTGINFLLDELGPKRLGLLRALIPDVRAVAFLTNPSYRDAEELKDVLQAARGAGMQSHVVTASTESEIDAAFARMIEVKVGALVVSADPFLASGSRRKHIVSLAARYALPTMYDFREFPEAGGLMSYDSNIRDAYRQAGVYVGRILRGEKPADLPVMQSTKFEFVINLQTAKMLGLSIPPSLLSLADEVIE